MPTVNEKSPWAGGQAVKDVLGTITMDLSSEIARKLTGLNAEQSLVVLAAAVAAHINIHGKPGAKEIAHLRAAIRRAHEELFMEGKL